MDNTMKPYEEYKKIGLPWLLNIPNHWEMTRNKNVLKMKNERVGKDHFRHTLLSLTKQGIIARDMINPKGKFPKEFDTYQCVNPKNIVFCLFDIDETPRTVGLSSLSGMITGAYTVFGVRDINEKYLYYYYLSLDNHKQLKPLYTGLRKVINTDTFLRTKIPLPPRSEQDQIVRYLDSKLSRINKFIKAKKKQIELLKEQKQAIINQAVTKGIDSDAKMKPSGIDWLGDIPEGWEIRRIKDITELASRGVTPVYTDEKLTKVVNQATFSKGYWDISKVRYTEVSPLNCRGVLKLYDVLLASTGGGVLGKVYHYTEEDLYIADSHVTILRCNKKAISKYVYYHFFIKYSFINAVLAQGSTNQTEIQSVWLNNFKLPIPTIAEQQLIINYLDKKCSHIDRIIEKITNEITLINEYRTTLISNVVTGKVDVRHIEVEDIIDSIEEDFDDLDEGELGEELEMEDDL